MKIFSLETKEHLIIWGVGLGVAIGVIVLQLTQFIIGIKECKGSVCTAMFDDRLAQKGWPFMSQSEFSGFPYQPYPVDNLSWKATLNSFEFWGNLIFWILVVFIILSLVRYFRKRNIQIPSNV